jgi:hypothetical protein
MAKGEPTARDLLEGLSAAFAPYLPLKPEDLFLLATYALSTWFIDCLQVAPMLFLSGPNGADLKSPLRLLEGCCRRALRVEDISSAALYALATKVRPTLLVDNSQGDPRVGRQAKETLRTGGDPGNFSLRNGEAHVLHFAKVLCSRYPIGDFDLVSEGIQILIPFDVRPEQPLDGTAIRRIRDEFVPQLFMFRLQNYYRVLNEQGLNTGGLSPATKELANAWAAPMLGDKGLLEKLLPQLREHDRLLLLDREIEPEWLVVMALLDCCHNVMREHRYVKEVASRASFYGAQGGGRTLTPKAAGLIIRALGIKPQNRRGDGTRILFTEKVKERIHLP